MGRISMDIEELREWVITHPPKFYWKDSVLVNDQKGTIGQGTSLHNVIGSCKRSYNVHFANGDTAWVEESKIKLDK